MYGNGNIKAGGYGNCSSFNPDIYVKGRAKIHEHNRLVYTVELVCCMVRERATRPTTQIVYMQPDGWCC